MNPHTPPPFHTAPPLHGSWLVQGEAEGSCAIMEGSSVLQTTPHETGGPVSKSWGSFEQGNLELSLYSDYC
jgi:hypothetical protein